MRAGPPVTVRYVDWRTRQGSAAYTANLNLNVKVLDFIQFGGAGGNRTRYLFNAIEALSQMSYSPTRSTARTRLRDMILANEPCQPQLPVRSHGYPVCHREERSDVAISFPYQRSLP